MDLLTYWAGCIFGLNFSDSSTREVYGTIFHEFWPVMTAYSLLEEKRFLVREIDSEAIVFDAVRLMDAYQVGALMVVKDDLRVGVISEWDYTRKLVLKNRSSKTTQVREIMTTEPVTVSLERTWRIA